MNVYRRNTFGDWLADVGWLYAVVVLLVVLLFLLPSLSTLGFVHGERGGRDLRSPAAGSQRLVSEAQEANVRGLF